MVFETESFFGVGGRGSEVESAIIPDTPPMLRQAQHDNLKPGSRNLKPETATCRCFDRLSMTTRDPKPGTGSIEPQRFYRRDACDNV